ncbi:hypothetical protein B0H63DRAFT_143351 [Podospora didyma]|uniref:BZIP transcription factor n=1 Tax=Podospora didyma TaxID=330526 RepID=A0AAE0NSM4_9PEZI|nr:hypothetical protein B0H63DRAFT_143351 [Podospora didyma]
MELQNALRQKAAAEAELAEVKRSLAKISSLIQPLLSRNSGAAGTVDQVSIPLAPPPSPGTRYSPILPRPPLQQQQPPSTHNAGSTSTSAAASPVETGPHGRWQTNSLSPVVPTLDTPKLLGDLSKQRHDFMHGLDLGPERLGLGSLLNLDPSKIPRIENGVNGAQDSAHYHHVPMKYDWNNPTAAFIRAGTAPERTSYGPPAAINSHFNEDSSSSSNNTNDTSNRLMSMPIINCASTCPLDGILLHFIAERRQRAAEGLSPEQIVGPRYPSVSSLLNPAQTLFSHPLSKVFTDILALFPDLPLPERVAVFFVMFLNMRYHIQPTSENYDRLPSWMRPEPCQLTKPHPAWIDHLPFPRMRERLIHEYIPGAYPFEDYFIPYTTTLCVNWPYEDTDALLQSPTGDLSEVLINPVFERHLRRAENWSLGEAFHLAYPNLAGTYNYRPTSQRGM